MRVASSVELGLQHTPGTRGLAVQGSRRAGLVARGLRDAANSSSNPLYTQAVNDYRAGRLEQAAAGFRLAAERGHAESQYLLSTLYDSGEGVPRDDAESARWERCAAEQGHPYAEANLSFRNYAAGNFSEAFAWCQRAAHQHLPWAQYNLGLMYRKGEGVPQNDAKAAHWYRLAAAQGFAEAQLKLADLYSSGRGVPLNAEEAAAWYRKAADQGNAEAQFQLSHLYDTGQGVGHDYVQSRHWIRKAAMQGHPQAMRELKRRGYRDA